MTAALPRAIGPVAQTGDFKIIEARSPDDFAAAKSLILEYADFLGEDLCFQGFAEEMARFPATYEAVLLARVGDKPAATVGLRRLDFGACEMKRLFARPAFRGLGLGAALCAALIELARTRGFAVMRLDTLARLDAAAALYRRLGFVEIAPYYDNPIGGVLFMELELNRSESRAG